MNEPVLIIMAAGMGSRYGGLKQIDPIDDKGHLIIDFSIYDAIKAGFSEVIFIIKKEIEEEFKQIIGNRISEKVKVRYVYQQLDNLPAGFTVPDGRMKPWGTGHAILSCKNQLDSPFAVINADDYYGVHAFKALLNFLSLLKDEEEYRYSMVGYDLLKTLTEYGHVARGITKVTKEGFLDEITERTQIEKHENKAQYTLDQGETWITIPNNSIASMNMWGFGCSILKELEKYFIEFLSKEAVDNPLKAEFFLPTVVDELVKQKKATVEVLKTEDRWYGVTYHEDKERVEKAIAKLKAEGFYPEEF